jgi:hypothetical protein
MTTSTAPSLLKKILTAPSGGAKILATLLTEDTTLQIIDEFPPKITQIIHDYCAYLSLLRQFRFDRNQTHAPKTVTFTTQMKRLWSLSNLDLIWLVFVVYFSKLNILLVN